MTYDARFTAVPEGWEVMSDAQYEDAAKVTHAALEHPEAVNRVASYYSRERNFAGATFLTVGPVDPHHFTTGDLLALTLLQVQASPVAVRRLTEPSRTGEDLERMLSDEHLPVNSDLALAEAAVLERMAVFHEAVKQALSTTESANANPWVTASKLTARKRPDLFPVRDSVVCDYLGLSKGRKHNYEVDWQVFRRLLQDDGIRGRLDQVLDEAARRPGVDIGLPNRRLRHLDAVLWMHARHGAETGDTGAAG